MLGQQIASSGFPFRLSLLLLWDKQIDTERQTGSRMSNNEMLRSMVTFEILGPSGIRVISF
jgi:hypothetical protein